MLSKEHRRAYEGGKVLNPLSQGVQCLRPKSASASSEPLHHSPGSVPEPLPCFRGHAQSWAPNRPSSTCDFHISSCSPGLHRQREV